MSFLQLRTLVYDGVYDYFIYDCILTCNTYLVRYRQVAAARLTHTAVI